MSIETGEITDEEIFSEEDLPESTPQNNLIHYLLEVLGWLYKAEGWFITSNLAVVYAPRKYLAPDVVVFKGVILSEEEQRTQQSYRLSEGRPAPQVVFEISSKDTWRNDLRDKPEQYLELGAKEYFAYDPNFPQYWRDRSTRLRGWRYVNGQTQPIVADEATGWLWSEELDSWLVQDGAYLRLYDRNRQRRPTEAEAEKAALETLLEKLRRTGIDPDKL